DIVGAVHSGKGDGLGVVYFIFIQKNPLIGVFRLLIFSNLNKVEARSSRQLLLLALNSFSS
ncbi:MAG TPA: hypothetical protein DEV38_04090, partial [Psychrobacter sp.]